MLTYWRRKKSRGEMLRKEAKRYWSSRLSPLLLMKEIRDIRMN
jgi:hypothetical protein